MPRRRFAIALALCFASPASAQEAAPVFTPAQVELVERLESELRCVVCQNQTIADSNAPLAGDMRRLVRERVLEGEGETEVKAFMTARYGEFVLFRPVFAPHTWALWAAPLLALLLGLWLAWRFYGQRGAAEVSTVDHEALSEADEARLAAMLGRTDGSEGELDGNQEPEHSAR